MPVFRALGTGLFLLIIGFMLTPVLREFEEALVAVLRGAKVSAETATELISSAAASIPKP